MSLRLRLVSALGLLLAVGLTAFGFGTYGPYSRDQYRKLDDRLHGIVPPTSSQLANAAGLTGFPAFGPPTSPGGPVFVAPTGTYGELRDASGTVVQTLTTGTTSLPAVPKVVASRTIVGVGSVSGSVHWRLTLEPARDLPGYTVVVAVPTTEVDQALRNLVVIELVGGVALLTMLTGGSWLILRRGLRPLEQMASTARSITAGDLSRRVEPDDGRGEVGQLGQAINTMLGEIEIAFDEREATERKLRQFLSDASHELRTPLTTIRGFAELFRVGANREHVDLDVIMRRIEEESTRMKALVEDLLLLARLDETRPFEPVPVDLTVLAADACSDAVAADPTRPVVLDAADPIVISGDRDHLRQAIANLTTNALRHTPSGTKIEVRTAMVSTEGGPVAQVVVRDHGAGLDDEALAHVFDRFWQADHARVGTGAGLGLSIVAAIAHEHGGTVTAANADDGGAVFTLRLPLESHRSAATPRAL